MSAITLRHAAIVVVATAALLLSSCDFDGSDKDESAAYSGAFWFWTVESHSVSTDLARLAEPPAAATGAAPAQQLQAAITKQRDLNRGLRAAAPPPVWTAKHARMLRALDALDDLLDLAAAAPGAPDRASLDRLEPARTLLVSRVVSCYAEGPACGQ